MSERNAHNGPLVSGDTRLDHFGDAFIFIVAAVLFGIGRILPVRIQELYAKALAAIVVVYFFGFWIYFLGGWSFMAVRWVTGWLG